MAGPAIDYTVVDIAVKRVLRLLEDADVQDLNAIATLNELARCLLRDAENLANRLTAEESMTRQKGLR